MQLGVGVCMARNRSKGWKRIGIVLSVVWFIGFGLFLWSNEVGRISDFHSFQLKHCYTLLNIANEALERLEKNAEWDRRWGANWAKYKTCQEEASKFYGG